MRGLLSVTATVTLLAGVAWGGGEDAKKDLAKMQGKWVVVKHQAGGKDTPDEQTKMLNIRLNIKDDKYVIYLGEGEAGKGWIKLDPSKKPAQLDIGVDSGETGKKQVMKAIYKWDGEDMVVVVSQPTDERPTEFKTSADKGWTMITYRRDMDKKDKK
jgi:uncharacterized protein (TIGR03067 family)